MIKRRNFLKMIPVGFLAAKFGGLVELVKPRIVGVPFDVQIVFSGNLELPTKPTWVTVIPYTDDEGNWFMKSVEPITITYV